MPLVPVLPVPEVDEPIPLLLPVAFGSVLEPVPLVEPVLPVPLVLPEVPV